MFIRRQTSRRSTTSSITHSSKQFTNYKRVPVSPTELPCSEINRGQNRTLRAITRYSPGCNNSVVQSRSFHGSPEPFAVLSLTVLTGPRRGEPPRHQPVRVCACECRYNLYKSRGLLSSVSRARQVINYVTMFAK